jgi:hypothetical protein
LRSVESQSTRDPPHITASSPRLVSRQATPVKQETYHAQIHSGRSASSGTATGQAGGTRGLTLASNDEPAAAEQPKAVEAPKSVETSKPAEAPKYVDRPVAVKATTEGPKADQAKPAADKNSRSRPTNRAQA